jgi:hypothetical protein
MNRGWSHQRCQLIQFLLVCLSFIVARQIFAGTVMDMGQLTNGTRIMAVQSAEGRWDLETKGPGILSRSHSRPIQVSYSWSEPDTPALQQGYDSVQKTAQGFEGKASVSGPSGIIFRVDDRWKTEADALCLIRRLVVSGNSAGGFVSSISFSARSALHREQIAVFAPGMLYGGTDHHEDWAIGGPATYREGQGRMQIREDRLPIPMVGVLSHDGSSITVLDPTPNGATTVADSHDRNVTTLTDSRFQFGAIVADDTAGHLSLGFCFPGTEGEVTYRGGTYPGGQIHEWRRRYHPLQNGFVQAYDVHFRFARGEGSFPEFYRNGWRWAWKVLGPAVYPQDIPLIRQSLIDMLAGRVVQTPSGTGIPNFIAWQGSQAPFFSRAAVMGFTGKNLEAARVLLGDSDRDPSARGEWHRKLALAIIKSFLTLRMNPPVGEGFDLFSGQPVVAIPRDQEVFLRSFGDDFSSLTKAYLTEHREGRDHSEWLKCCIEFANWLLTQQDASGGFPRAWRPGTGEVADASLLSGYNAIAFLALLSQATENEKYLHAAIRSADFCWSSGQSDGIFVGGTIDNPNVIDKEAGTLSLEAYLALHEVTHDRKWLQRAEAAANYAETWIYCWNVPMPGDEADGNLHWKRGVPTIGLQLIATGHSLVDEYMAGDAGAYLQLHILTRDPHYLDVARILLNDTKAMVAIPGRLYDLPGPGWQQEHWSLAPVRGLGLHRGWLPWVATSQLDGLYESERLDPEAFKRLYSRQDSSHKID